MELQRGLQPPTYVLHVICADAWLYKHSERVWLDFHDAGNKRRLGSVLFMRCRRIQSLLKTSQRPERGKRWGAWKGGGSSRRGRRPIRGDKKRVRGRSGKTRSGGEETEQQPPPLWGSHSINVPPLKIEGNGTGTATTESRLWHVCNRTLPVFIVVVFCSFFFKEMFKTVFWWAS